MVRLLDIIFVPSAAASNIGTTVSTTSSEDPTVLTPPIPPAQLNREFVVSLKQGDPTGASIHISGPYLGFSIGLSVSDRVIGKNSSVLAVPFLNHIVNVANHAGAVRVRVGGNGAQISSWFVITKVLKSNRLRKNNPASGGTARRRDIDRITAGTHYYAASRVAFALDFVKMLGNLSSLVKTEFYLGLDFANITDTSNQVAFAAMTEEVLGSNLHDISPGNELDFYDRPGYNKRPSPYTFRQYMDEWGNVPTALATNPAYTNRNILMGPSTCCESSKGERNHFFVHSLENRLKVHRHFVFTGVGLYRLGT
ncbi:unnamed protein product [Rhizoctonia solani]|uniref:Glycoside hydrolase family 79 protein n=1 Tax=Rhizoctonia solani TaxID=456999 RepID=A0A8H3H8A5_9AGAM|nr:uncharacterized protein RhiXN_12304 [Rhizoctonia solani]QRW26643.1 hypothetical protein RhiXN_12304 [Rhizoctonia solani]CAE6487374.1 unnamed protein product [Rhizoctonia solani]